MSQILEPSLHIKVSGPQGEDALALLHEAALEARALYPELHAPNAPLPGNLPTPPRGIYLLVFDDARPVGSGALRPLDEVTVEIRRMYVLKEYRRHGVARMILEALEQEAVRLQYRRMRLETGNRQFPAMRLYEAYGFTRIPPFGPYVNDPISVCYEKVVQANSRIQVSRRRYMTPEEFIHAYENALASQDWGQVEPLVHAEACVTFSNGTVHKGKAAVQKAFEHNFSLIKDETYSMSNVHWVMKTELTAVYLFEFNWSGIIDGKPARGAGRGTSVLIRDANEWQLLVEHLGTKES